MFIPLSKDSYFILVNYRVDNLQNAFLEFYLSHLKINLCLPYILKLYQMVIEATNSSQNQSNQAPKQPQQLQENEVVQINTNQTNLTVTGKIELPEIVLFAEPEKINSKTLIMNTDLLLNFKSRGSSTELEINLADLGIRLGENMNASARQGIPFLNPCTARVTMRQVNSDLPAQYKAYIGSLNLNMTPTMYQVVMGVINTINKTGTEKVRL